MTINLDRDAVLSVLRERGWTQGTWERDDGKVCLHQALKLCVPVPGDFHLIEAVANHFDWGTSWNDEKGRTWAEVEDRCRRLDVTDADLEATFGPQWRAIVSLVRRAAVLTYDEAMLDVDQVCPAPSPMAVRSGRGAGCHDRGVQCRVAGRR